MRFYKVKYFNAKGAETQSTQRREWFFVGRTLVRRHSLSTPLNLKYKIISLSQIFSFATSAFFALKAHVK